MVCQVGHEILPGVATGGLVECVSGYWELTVINGDRLEGRGTERVDRKENIWVCHQNL